MLPWTRKVNLKKTVIKLAGVLAVVFLLLNFSAVLAQDSFGIEPVQEGLLLGGADIRLIVAKIIRAVLGLLGLIALAIILYAGYTIMTAGGNEEKVAQGRKILINAIIGLVIIMSALGIVQFIIGSLSGQGGIFGTAPGTVKTEKQNFIGSGALGRVVKDHYPARDQTGVPRNISLVVTFAASATVDPASIIINSNNTCWGEEGQPTPCDDDFKQPYYGDCYDANQDNVYQMAAECDQLKTSAVAIYLSTSTPFAQLKPSSFVQASALTVYEEEGQTRTFVFRPHNFLGSESDDQWYSARLTNEIKSRLDNKSVFSGQHTSYYEWKFQTGTHIDLEPPHVKAVAPAPGQTAFRNQIVRIDFSEPMDPTSVSGLINPPGFTNIILNTPGEGETPLAPTGKWSIVNGYRSVEFISDEACGLNSCGQMMYCLPLSCPVDDKDCERAYEVLALTADLLNQSDQPFAALAFSGAMDLASNALDNGPNNQPDGQLANPHKPAIGDLLIIEEVEKVPDNYYWSFSVLNQIDRTAPYIENITPDIDEEGVAGEALLTIYFSRPMRYLTLYDVSLTEYPPLSQVHPNGDDLWFVLGNESEEPKAVTWQHRVFGPDGFDLYYFPAIPSTAQSETQNCLYPGRGPSVAGQNCAVKYNEQGEIESVSGCLSVTAQASSDTGCAHASESGEKITSSAEECLEILQSISPSQYQQ